MENQEIASLPERVPKPLKRPNYAEMLGDRPTVEKLREVAVQAMHDELTVQWFPGETLTYTKTGACANKTYHFFREKIYQGLPYTNAGMGIYQFLEYYDPENGCISYNDCANINWRFGNSCAPAATWGMYTGCTSMKGKSISNYMTIPNGFYPLGNVKYEEDLFDFNNHTTKQILAENGDQTVMEGYALLQPADLVVYSEGGPSGGHVMMAITKPCVVRTASGEIDPNESYVYIQDQQAREDPVEADGVPMVRSGRPEVKISFATLLQKMYIAVTVAEYMGKKPYEKTRFSLSGEFKSPEDLRALTLSCNRPIAVVKIVAETPGGEKSLVARHLFTRYEIGSGVALDYPVNSIFEGIEARPVPEGPCALTLWAVAADGVEASYTVSVK